MNLQELLQALEASCQGKSESDRVEVDVQVLLSAKDELSQQAQLREDLQQARDEASMRPSVARKLNEKIRALEGELELLRTNKKVKDLEKKVQFLSEELKQSYTTKNFTLKSGLLDLEKQYRAHMNVDPAMAAFWADVTVLLDENRDKDAPLQFKGPPRPADMDSSTHRTPRQSTGSQLDAAAAAAAAAAQGSSSIPGDGAALQLGSSSRSSGGGGGSKLAADGSSTQQQQQQQQGVQLQVKSFNTIICEEEASAASILQDKDKPPGQGSAGGAAGEMVRQGAGFRVIRASQPGEAAAAAGGSCSGGGSVVEESLQPVAVLKDSYASRLKDVTFSALPAALNSKAAAGDEPQQQQQQQQQVVDARAIDKQADTVSSSVITLQQLFEQLAEGNPDSSSAWQQQVQQLAAAVQHLKDSAAAAAAAGTGSAGPPAELLQQQAEAESLLQSVQQLRESFAARSSSSGAASDAITAAAVDKQLAAVHAEVSRLQQLQQQASREAGSQQLLVQVFGEFLQQLEQQGVIAPTVAATATAAALGASAAADGQQQQQHVLLDLLKGFLAVNPHVPQLLASQLSPPQAAASPEQPAAAAAAAAASEQAVSSDSTARAQSVDVGTQADAVDVPAAAAAVAAATQTAAELPAAESQVAAPAAASGGAEAPSPNGEIQASDDADPFRAAADTPLPASVPAYAPAAAAAAAASDLAAAADSEPQPAAAAAASQGQLLSEQADPHSGSGIIYSASGSELSVGKVAVGQQLDLLHQLQRRGSPSEAGDVDAAADAAAAAAAAAAAPDREAHVAAVIEVKPEELSDLDAVAKELSKLRADNLELAASLQVTQSLVQHLNTNMKVAIDKADDAEADSVQAKQQLAAAATTLQQLQNEHAELTRVLIDAKVEIAEKKGELMKLLRNLRRAVENPTNSGMLKELQQILAIANKHEGDGAAAAADVQPAPGPMARSFTANLAAGVERLGQAFKDSSSMRLSMRRGSSDSGSTPLPAAVSSGGAAGGAAGGAGPAAAAPAAGGEQAEAGGSPGDAQRRASDTT